MHTYRYLLFDQDGTLTDSMPGITRCVQHALRHFDIEVDDCNQLTPFIGPPLRDSFREFYGFSPTEAEQATALYGERYDTIGLFENRVYEAVPELLSALTDAGYRLFVATSKPTALARRILEHYDLLRWFEFVGGGEPSGRCATKAGVIDYVLTMNGIQDRSCALMIGDRKHDMLGARSAGIDSAGVLWGYGDRAELESHGATHITREIDDLATLLGVRHIISHNE